MNVSQRKTKKLSLLIVILIFLIHKNSFALTVEELVKLAEKQNPELLKIKKELSVLEKKVKVAKRWFNPSVSVSINGSELLKNPLESGRIYIKQYIPYPKKFDIQKNIEKKKYMSEYYLLLAKKEKIFSDIYSTAYEISLKKKLISVCDKYINILNTVKKNISDKADSLRIEDTLLSIKEEKIKYQYQKEKLLSKLSKLVNQEIKDVSAEFTTSLYRNIFLIL